MLPARLDNGLVRLVAVVSAIAIGALLFNPELPLLFIPAIVIAAIAATLSYRRDHSEGWWKWPAAAFVVASVLTIAAVFYLLAQK